MLAKYLAPATLMDSEAEAPDSLLPDPAMALGKCARGLKQLMRDLSVCIPPFLYISVPFK